MRLLLYIVGGLVVVYLWAICPRLRRPTDQLRELMVCRFAHRGLHGDGVPENSLTAFRLAAERGVGVELDVRLTKDKRLVVFHDSGLFRMCGVTGKVERMNWRELKQLRLQDTEEGIPLLEEVLEILCGRSPAIIEVKTTGKNVRELCERLCKELERYRGLFCLESFDPRVLRWLRKNEPFIARGQLAENFLKKSDQVKLAIPLRILLTTLTVHFIGRPDFVAFRNSDRRRNLSLRICRKFFRMPEVSWTIVSPMELKAAEADGRAVIFEGFVPDEAKRQRPEKETSGEREE